MGPRCDAEESSVGELVAEAAVQKHMRFAPGSAEPEPAEANAEAAEPTGSAEEEWLVRSGHQGVWHGLAHAVRKRPRELVLSPSLAEILRDSSRMFVDSTANFCSIMR